MNDVDLNRKLDEINKRIDIVEEFIFKKEVGETYGNVCPLCGHQKTEGK